jgi:hypothetical protein
VFGRFVRTGLAVRTPLAASGWARFDGLVDFSVERPF